MRRAGEVIKINEVPVPSKVDIEAAITEARRRYSRLVLLVGPPHSGKAALLSSFADANQLAIRNVSLEVSAALLEFGKRQRMTHAASVFLDVVSSKNDPVLLDKTEIIFEHSLALDPIRLLSQLARNVTVVATWSGTYRDGKLTYASPSHPEFRSIDEVDAVIINMDGS